MFEKNSVADLNSIAAMLRRSLAVRLFVIGVILLILLIPAVLVSSLISERQNYYRAAVAEISEKWGGSQTVAGPLLLLPGRTERTVLKDDKQIRETVTENFLILPEELRISAAITPEIRYRGIYEVVLYQAKLILDGSFLPRPENAWQFDFNQANLLMPVSDLTGIRQVRVTVDGREYPARPGIALNPPPREERFQSGFHVRPAIAAGENAIPFHIELELNGSGGLMFLPLGRTTGLVLDSSWNAPSFQGSFLPFNREIRPDGFHAEYQVTELNRNFPQMAAAAALRAADSDFGVALVVPVNIYLQASRTAKYAVLFIIAALLALLFTERLTGVTMHPAQYLVSGLGIVLFYAILLSTAEHIGFGWGFILASLLTAGALTFYCRLVFRSLKTASILGLLLLLGYGVLYLVLQLQDFALLAGVSILFLLLLALMLVTGRMNREPVQP